MSDISGQLIKNSYDYVLQSDLVSGNVYRIGGAIPINPKFLSGLTAFSSFTYSNGSEQNGYILTSDNFGNATWSPLAADIFVTGFTYNNNSFTILNNSGLTLTATINDVTGFTINGDLIVTGNTYIDGLTATTISATTYQNLPIDPDTYVTAFTYNNNEFTIFDNSGNTFSATINNVTGLTINGDLIVTGNTSLSGVTNYYVNVSGTNPYEIINVDYFTAYTLQNDVYVTGSTLTSSTDNTQLQQSTLLYHGVPIGGPYTIDTENTYTTGGTYDNLTKLISFERNDGNGYTVDLTTIDTNDTYVTGGTNNPATTSSPNATIDLLYNQDVPPSTYFLPYTDVFVTGFTYDNSNTFTILDNSGNTFSQTINDFTGLTINGDLTVTGSTNLSGLTQYDEVVSGTNPIEIVNVDYLTGYVQTNDVYVTGATYTAATTNSDTEYWELLYHSNPLGGPYVITGQNTFITGFTYSNNNFDIKDNSGNTFNVIVNDFTGLTINGDLLVTGDTTIQNSLSANTVTITSTPNLNNNLTQILGRNSTTGLVEYREVNTLGNNYTYVSGVTYSATTTDNVIGVDSSISATTIYLPDSVTSGRLRYDIKDIGLNSYNNNITIISTGLDTIISTENSNTVILQSDGGALIIFNTGTGTWLQM